MNDLLTVADELLDEMFSHEAGCQSGHRSPGNTDCSGSVTHVSTARCGPALLVCANAGAFIATAIHNGNPCNVCFNSAHDCWSVTPA